MKADVSRLTFGREKHYHGVIKQQGRVDLDADWNEQNEILSSRVETEAVDVIGASGAPIGDAGFTLSATSGGANINISKGRAYVDGLLCENEQNVLITAQPDLPGFALPTAAGVYIAYLEVWLRHLTALDDADMREVALGGPDTCSRVKTVWQVNLLDVAAPGTNVTCATPEPNWDALIAPSSGMLAAQVVPTPASSPCGIAAAGGYSSLLNQLYRVEIHDPGGANASFKWSRDNGSVVASWTAQAGANNEQLTISSNGPDDALGFAPGQWIELVSDANELSFKPGVLAPLTGVSANILTIDPSQATGAVTGFKFPAKIRRWDSAGRVALTTGTWLNLENGVQVQFSAGTFATADYWLIPARTLTPSSVDWPTNPSGQPAALSPKGIKRHYCKLAVVNLSGNVWSIAAPCLPTFPPLTQITTSQVKAIHVTNVQLAPSVVLPNDSDVLIQPQLNDKNPFGLVITCDAPIDPASVQPATCYVEVEKPYPLMENIIGLGSNTSVLGFERLILSGTVGVTGNAITWTLNNKFPLIRIFYDALSVLRQQKGVSRLRLRLVLKGDLIWGLNDPTTYLDGEAFGITRTDPDGSKHISLNFPSGDGKRGGDFEFWFWLFLPVTPDSVVFTNLPSPIFAGQTSTGTVTLNGPAPTGGALVTLTPQALANGSVPTGATVATMPASVTIAAGQTSNTFAVTGTSVPAGDQSVTLRVTAAYENGQAVGDLTINPVLSVASVNLTPTSLLADGRASVSCSVTLSGPAPSGGAVVALTYDNTGFAAATPQASVTVPAGQTTSPAFAMVPKALAINGNTVTVKVTATYNNSSKSNSFDITAQRLT